MSLTRETTTTKPSEVQKKWWVIDADGVVLGRLASTIALMLRGKHKPSFTTNIDCGDNIIVLNAHKVKMTGKKASKKVYYHHTGYAGGIKERRADFILAGKFPERVLKKAVERMMPEGPMGTHQFKKLYVYAGDEHPHAGQQPEVLDVAARNPKNKR